MGRNILTALASGANNYCFCKITFVRRFSVELKILYEDNHIIAAEKPCGVLSQGDASGEPSMLDHVKEYIKERYNKPGAVFLGLLHRLDRQVSGAMIFARTSRRRRGSSTSLRQARAEAVLRAGACAVGGGFS
jgi:23S rRNA pseudouridine1911/1915/1917 synthase